MAASAPLSSWSGGKLSDDRPGPKSDRSNGVGVGFRGAVEPEELLKGLESGSELQAPARRLGTPIRGAALRGNQRATAALGGPRGGGLRRPAVEHDRQGVRGEQRGTLPEAERRSVAAVGTSLEPLGGVLERPHGGG